jgi:hypothetical protein
MRRENSCIMKQLGLFIYKIDSGEYHATIQLWLKGMANEME